MRIDSFYTEESKVNKGVLLLIALDENGDKYVVGGDPHNTIRLVPYEQCFDVIGADDYKKLCGY